jgi:hypothetical protein
MTSKARGPNIQRGALVSIDAGNPTPNVIGFYYNPAMLKRSLQPQMVGGEQGDRSESVRFTGAPVETIEVEIELDAADALEQDDPVAIGYGLYPQLAALELLMYPHSAQVVKMEALLEQGTMEVLPLSAPRLMFVWGARRALPVRLTSYAISEDAFDAALNPIRATVTLAMRVLNYNDLNSSAPDYDQFLANQRAMEYTSTLRAASLTG